MEKEKCSTTTNTRNFIDLYRKARENISNAWIASCNKFVFTVDNEWTNKGDIYLVLSPNEVWEGYRFSPTPPWVY